MKRTKLFTGMNKHSVSKDLNKFLRDHEPNVELDSATFHQFLNVPVNCDSYGIFATFKTSTSYGHKGDEEGLWD